MLFVNYPKCSTCKKAKKWLDDNCITYEDRDIKTYNPSEDELRKWHKISGLPLKKFFNTSGILYREMELSKKITNMTEDEMFSILASDGMLVKRPIVADEKFVVVGFNEKIWSEIIK